LAAEASCRIADIPTGSHGSKSTVGSVPESHIGDVGAGWKAAVDD
jgi:hypothetical protein